MLKAMHLQMLRRLAMNKNHLKQISLFGISAVFSLSVLSVPVAVRAATTGGTAAPSSTDQGISVTFKSEADCVAGVQAASLEKIKAYGENRIKGRLNSINFKSKSGEGSKFGNDVSIEKFYKVKIDALNKHKAEADKLIKQETAKVSQPTGGVAAPATVDVSSYVTRLETDKRDMKAVVANAKGVLTKSQADLKAADSQQKAAEAACAAVWKTRMQTYQWQRWLNQQSIDNSYLNLALVDVSNQVAAKLSVLTKANPAANKAALAQVKTLPDVAPVLKSLDATNGVLKTITIDEINQIPSTASPAATKAYFATKVGNLKATKAQIKQMYEASKKVKEAVRAEVKKSYKGTAQAKKVETKQGVDVKKNNSSSTRQGGTQAPSR